MEELKEMEILGDMEMPPEKGHYEVVKEYTEERPIYDENGQITGYETVVTGREKKWVWTDKEELAKQQKAERIKELKAELAKVMEDIGQEQLGLVRDDYAQKRARAAEIINELRVLEGKAARELK